MTQQIHVLTDLSNRCYLFHEIKTHLRILTKSQVIAVHRRQEKEATMSAKAKSHQVVTARISFAATEIVRSIVQHPGQVVVDVLESDHARAVLLLKVHSEDIETLLGHEGRILRALRTFTYAVAAKNNIAIELQVQATRPPPGQSLQSPSVNGASIGQTPRSDPPDESQSGL